MRTIAHVSDLHFGTHSDAVVEALLACLAKTKPDLIAVSGDLTQRARRAEFTQAQAFLKRLPSPFIVIPGNHDIPLYDALSRILDPFAKYESFIGPDGLAEAFYGDDEIAVLGLNTVRRLTGKNGRVSYRQMAEIVRKFGSIDRSLFRVLVTHHPLGLPTGSNSIALAGRSSLALAAVAEAGVHLLLSGHYHVATAGGIDAERAAGGSILVVHAGTALSSRTRGEANSFNIIRVSLPDLDVRVFHYS